MRFEPRHVFRTSVPVALPWPDTPPHLAILGHALAPDVAREVLSSARRNNTCPVRELIVNGFWSETRYYAALARYLDVPFVRHWPAVDESIDPVVCVDRGCVRLANGTSLVAPQGAALEWLCERSWCPRDVAITTPAHLLALIHRAKQTALEHMACEQLPAAAPHLSARRVASRHTVVIATATATLLLFLAITAPQLVFDVFGMLFFAAMSLRLLATAGGSAAIDPRPRALEDCRLPDYSILVPLRGEAPILPNLLSALEKLDYPRAKLQVLLLIEPEDREMRAALEAATLPPWLQVVFGPVGGNLRTKPRALNLGLAAARGSIVTVYDAEDRPEPDQLRRAVARFAAEPNLACLQARLVMEEGHRLLDRLFAIEYAALFDAFNIGLARADLPIPLGGTSNHFRIDALREAGGWDAWNVTEDADLGLRLARFGYRIDCFDSRTFETAPDTYRDWMKQRRRWTKGWMQTLFVLSRDMPRAVYDLGPYRAIVVGLILTNLVVGTLALPIAAVWLASKLVMCGVPSPRTPLAIAEATLASSVLLSGLLAPIWCGYAGLRASGRLNLLRWLPLLLPYQLMISIAAWCGLWDLLVRPFHWHKTPHPARATKKSRDN